jgi:uncharacterized protein
MQRTVATADRPLRPLRPLSAHTGTNTSTRAWRSGSVGVGFNQTRAFSTGGTEGAAGARVGGVGCVGGGRGSKGKGVPKGHDLLPPDGKNTSIIAYGETSFQIDNKLVRQSVILLPENFLLWDARTVDDITIESLLPLSILSPTLEVLFVGTGDKMHRLSESLKDHFRRRGIVIEESSTMNAASTYNLLIGEGRHVGAALLTLFPWTGDDRGVLE